MLHQKINRRWDGSPCIVAATGPSLTAEVAATCRLLDARTIAVNDAYRLLPWADVLYACDAAWWEAHAGCTEFAGEKWSSHQAPLNLKEDTAARFGLDLVSGNDSAGFSTNPHRIHYGGNSGFQAINLAILWGCGPILLVGFDQREVDGKKHFFGDHVGEALTNENPSRFLSAYQLAAKKLPPGVSIINCTPASALKCFRQERLEDALAMVA